jgi:rhodanese-related sulfurtransferase
MERILEFIGNNLFWVSLWFAVSILLLWNLFGDILLGITQLEPGDVTRRINHDDATVVDLRGSSEFASGHILNAINIPDAEFSTRKKELDKFRSKPVILYCQNGQASTRMVKILKAEGFEDVSGLKGGLSSWQRAGLPLSRSGKKGQGE